jgi:hypothetical protein
MNSLIRFNFIIADFIFLVAVILFKYEIMSMRHENKSSTRTVGKEVGSSNAAENATVSGIFVRLLGESI